MQSNEYKIERWDAIYDDKLNLKTPLVYIVPDQPLIEFAKINKDTLYANIRGTGNDCYDNKFQVSLVSIKETRPNLFDKTGYYTLKFSDAVWFGYPKSLGTVSFEGVNQLEVQQVKSEVEVNKENQSITEAPQTTIEKFINLDKKPNLVIIVLAVLLIIVLSVRFIPVFFKN